MSFECKILADSINDRGHRLTTFEVVFPRMILAEVNTHRMLSRNSASSRATPVEKAISAIMTDMFIPVAFGRNQRGMQADEVLNEDEAALVRRQWIDAGQNAIVSAQEMAKTGVHKAWANRPIEPYKWHKAVITATEWSNFFALRTHQDAQPEFRQIACMMREVYLASTPHLMQGVDWHLPYVGYEEMRDALKDMRVTDIIERFKKVSIGRCARTSVEGHDGSRDADADIGLHNRLRPAHHLSPFEHVARPFTNAEWHLVDSVQEWISHVRTVHKDRTDARHADYLWRQAEFQGNLRGWHSARMDVENEHDYALAMRKDALTVWKEREDAIR